MIRGYEKGIELDGNGITLLPNNRRRKLMYFCTESACLAKGDVMIMIQTRSCKYRNSVNKDFYL